MLLFFWRVSILDSSLYVLLHRVAGSRLSLVYEEHEITVEGVGCSFATPRGWDCTPAHQLWIRRVSHLTEMDQVEEGIFSFASARRGSY